MILTEQQEDRLWRLHRVRGVIKRAACLFATANGVRAGARSLCMKGDLTVGGIGYATADFLLADARRDFREKAEAAGIRFSEGAAPVKVSALDAAFQVAALLEGAVQAIFPRFPGVSVMGFPNGWGAWVKLCPEPRYPWERKEGAAQRRRRSRKFSQLQRQQEQGAA